MNECYNKSEWKLKWKESELNEHAEHPELSLRSPVVYV